MATLGDRAPLDLLPQQVLDAMSALHIALREHTTYDAVQVTFPDMRSGMSLPTIDVQVNTDSEAL